MLHTGNRKLRWKKLRRYFTLLPLGSIVALLALLSALVNPNSDFTTEVYAADSSTTSSASLSIANSTLSKAGKPGETITMSSNIGIEGSLISSYNLQISSGNTDNSTALVGPTNIPTITSETSTLANNTWGYSWDGSNYKGITTSPVTIDNSGVNSAGNVSYTKTLTFAAKFSENATAGHYAAKVNLKLTATPRGITYTLNYNANDHNNGNSTTNLPAAQAADSPNSSYTFTLSNTKPTRSGAEFQGWATASDATTASYQPGGTITLQSTTPAQTLYAIWKETVFTIYYDANGGTGAPSPTTGCYGGGIGYDYCAAGLSSVQPTREGYVFLGWNTDRAATTAKYTPGFSGSISPIGETSVTLYAIWQKPLFEPTPGFTSITTMQQMTSSICNAEKVGAYKDLTDTRDSRTYRVMKFPGGKCWMTQDLNLPGGTTITSSSSNVSSNYTLPDSDINKFRTNSTSESVYNGDSSSFYSWCAAVAGTCNSVAVGSSATSSICPKGWTLPTGGDNGDFGTFLSVADIQKSNIGAFLITSEPYSFITQGFPYYTYTMVIANTAYGYWWSSTKTANSTSSTLYIKYNKTSLDNTVYISSSSSNTYSAGYNVRCVSR